MDLTGIHHLTAVTAKASQNYHFYTDVLGMRLVKRTVNQDDVRAYHLFYADAAGSPGTDVTFFDWNAPPERRGTRSIIRTFLRISGRDSLDWWADRLSEHGASGVEVRDGRFVLDFEDPEGQRLSLVDDGGEGDEPAIWDESPVPAEHQIRGLGPIMLSVPQIEPTERILTQIMNMRRARSYPAFEAMLEGSSESSEIVVFEMGDGGAHAELHVVAQPDLPPARQGAGAVHHVAFRTPDDEVHGKWIQRLREYGMPNSGRVDRYYFRSLYFREPGGILFEIATDGPGFAVDEDPETLGEKLVLPPFLENRREDIVAHLQPIE